MLDWDFVGEWVSVLLKLYINLPPVRLSSSLNRANILRRRNVQEGKGEWQSGLKYEAYYWLYRAGRWLDLMTKLEGAPYRADYSGKRAVYHRQFLTGRRRIFYTFSPQSPHTHTHRHTDTKV